MIQTGHCRVISEPQHTENYFGPISEVAGKTLQVIERNEQGDCLCVFTSEKEGQAIVDVDHRDVRWFNEVKSTSFQDMIRLFALLLQSKSK